VELVYFPPSSWSGAVRQGRAALVCGALVVPTIAVKVLTRNPLSDDPRYADHSWRGLVQGMRDYHSFLLYGNLFGGGLPIGKLLALWAAIAAAAMLLRSRAMTFGLCFLIVSLVPVCLISPRAGYMCYIPLMGAALYIGALFERLRDLLFAWASLRPRPAAAAKWTALAAVAAVIIHAHAARLGPVSIRVRQEHDDLRRIIEQLQRAHPRLPRGASLLLVDDPLPDGFAVLFLARLAYGDPTLEVDRIKMLGVPPAGDEIIRYDYVLAGGWELRDMRGIGDARAPVDVGFRPRRVRPGAPFTIEIPDYAGQTVDLATSTIGAGLPQRAVVRNCCRLDRCGRATLVAPPDLHPGTVQIRWIRAQGGREWQAAEGALDIGP
jgi:hypothetical protein